MPDITYAFTPSGGFNTTQIQFPPLPVPDPHPTHIFATGSSDPGAPCFVVADAEFIHVRLTDGVGSGVAGALNIHFWAVNIISGTPIYDAHPFVSLIASAPVGGVYKDYYAIVAGGPGFQLIPFGINRDMVISFDTFNRDGDGLYNFYEIPDTDIELVEASGSYHIEGPEECGGPSTGPPGGGGLGIDVLAHRVGHWVAAGGGVNRAWHPDLLMTDSFTFDDNDDAAAPRLAMEPHQDRLSVVYRRGDGSSGAPYNIWRKFSHDWGQTWIKDPPDDTPLIEGVKYAVEVVNTRTQERCDLYNDQGEIDSGTSLPTGRGAIQCAIYDRNGGLIDTFPAGGAGIGGELADDTPFSAFFMPEPTGLLQTTFAVGGLRKVYRSNDDGRTWKEWIDDPATP